MDFIFAWGLFGDLFPAAGRKIVESTLIAPLNLKGRWWVEELSPDFTRLHLRSHTTERRIIELPQKFVWDGDTIRYTLAN